MCSKFRTVSAIFTDIWCIQEPQVAKCWYSNIEQRKWCRTTEIWGIGVNENVRHIFGPDNVRYIQEVLDDLNSTLWISDSRYRFLDSMFPDSGGFLDLNSQRFWIPLAKICRFPESGYRTLYGAKYPYLHGAKLFSMPRLRTFLRYQHTHCFHAN